MIVLRFRAQCQPDKAEEALAAFRAVVAPSRELEGVIVRPPETAFPGRVSLPEMPGQLPAKLNEIVEETAKIRVSPKRYLAALRDWAENGADSRFALDPDEVVQRSKPLPPEASLAAAHFELAQHLHRAGDATAAVAHFREAHRLQPENWTYKRQAWSLNGPEGPLRRFWQGPLEGQDWPYDDEYAAAIEATPPGAYYPPVRR